MSPSPFSVALQGGDISVCRVRMKVSPPSRQARTSSGDTPTTSSGLASAGAMPDSMAVR